ncbi:hypothetical protein BGX28_003650 [Mortierella sp. GBA30]|nr:hypothetical protein BGX28_003650 [Mortierella sp. GBA30]
MGQPSQGWAYGSGPMPGMNQARPPMSGFPSMMQSSMMQQQQQNQSSQQMHSHPAHQQEIIDMSDFPALGTVNNASSNPGLSAASYASTAGTVASSSATASANGLPQEFSIEDDFPALPGARPNSASSSRHFGSMQLHQQQQQPNQTSRSQQSLQHHPSQQQTQHLIQQSQLDGMGAFSSMMGVSSGSQLQQSLQLQQQLASDMMFQQQHSLAQQQLLHLNGAQSPLNAHLGSPSNEVGKATKSYATKASNGSGLFATSTGSSLSGSSAGTTSVGTEVSNTASLSGAVANVSARPVETDLGAPGSTPSNPEAKDQNQIQLDDHDRFGLFGMLGVIRMADQDSTTLTLGRDLTTLGLSLNSAEPLYGTFASPWFEVTSSADVEAEFHVPACYNVQPPPPAQAKLSAVLDETLFYMFYSMPRDALQDAAAAELYNRHWRYHKELRLWLMKDQSSEQSKTPTFERGSYIFFDPNSWEKVKKDFIVMYDALEERRQISALQSNAIGAVTSHAIGSSSASGSSASSASNLVNGGDVGAHTGLLNSLNLTSTPGPASTQQGHLKQSASMLGVQAQSFQQQRQPQQQQQQKSLQMMNMGSGGHGPFSSIGSHGLQSHAAINNTNTNSTSKQL